MKNNDLIPIGEASRLLRVSIMTLRRWDESGRLSSIRQQPGGHRYYRKLDIEIFLSDLMRLAHDWIITQSEFPEMFYCQTSAVFQARLTKMQNLMIDENYIAVSQDSQWLAYSSEEKETARLNKGIKVLPIIKLYPITFKTLNPYDMTHDL